MTLTLDEIRDEVFTRVGKDHRAEIIAEARAMARAAAASVIRGKVWAAAREQWPGAGTKASEWPHAAFCWKSVAEVLEFHADHISDAVADWQIAAAVDEAVYAESKGKEPKPWKVPDAVREIYGKSGERGTGSGERGTGKCGVECGAGCPEARRRTAWVVGRGGRDGNFGIDAEPDRDAPFPRPGAE